MATIHGIPFNGGMDSPSGTGAQNIVETCTAIAAWLNDGSQPFKLKDDQPATALDWNARQLVNHGGTIIADWNAQRLISGNSFVVLDWATQQLTPDSSNNATLDWATTELVDANNVLSAAWTDRHLVDTDGTTIQITYANGLFFPNVPNADPAVTGQVYFDPITGNLKISL